MHWVEANRFLKGGVMLKFNASEFLHVLRKIPRLLNEVLVELRAIRELLEENNEPSSGTYVETTGGGWRWEEDE